MDVLRRALGAACLVYALIFATAAMLHAGVDLGVPGQPVIVPAAIVETLCCGAMLAGSHRALTGRPRAWDGLIHAHAVALSGVLLGILAVGFGASEATGLLDWYHRTIAVLLALGLGGAFYASRVRPSPDGPGNSS
jgi:hypothetical protein